MKVSLDKKNRKLGVYSDFIDKEIVKLRELFIKCMDKNFEVSLNNLGALQSQNMINRECIKQRISPVGLQVQIALNIGCNANCIMCGRKLFDPNSIFSYDDVISIIDDFDNETVHTVKLLGGEPLLDGDGLLKVLQKCNEKNLRLWFNTNGSKLTIEYIDMLVANGLGESVISIDAVGELHDSIRNFPGLFKHLEEMINYTLNKHKNFKINIEAVVMKANIDNIPELVNWADELGLNSITLTKLQNHNENYEKLKVNYNEAKDLFEKINLLNVGITVNADFFSNGKENKDCLLNSLNMNSNRKIMPCNREVKCGFYLDGTIKQLYKDESFCDFLFGILDRCKGCNVNLGLGAVDE